MTFLQFVCEKLMGPPLRGGMWLCPFHEDKNPSLSVRPPKDNHPIKFKCWSCGAWGDEHDLLKLFYPNEDYPKRLARLGSWRWDYEEEVEQNQHVDSFSRGSGITKTVKVYDTEVQEDEFSDEADAAIKQVLEYVGNPSEIPADEYGVPLRALAICKRVLEICGEFKLHPGGLAGRVGFEVWGRGTEAKHFAEVGESIADCDPKTCQASHCRGYNETAKRKARIHQAIKCVPGKRNRTRKN
jgi:hypothetical protein